MKKRQKKPIKKRNQDNANNVIISLAIRYFLALVLSAGSLYIFYYVFKPLTFYPVSFILSLFYSVDAYSPEWIIAIGDITISLVNACIAGSAYYLLAVLNLATPGIRLMKRIKIFIIDSAILLLLNITRIIILSILLVNSSSFFDATHLVFWHLISIVFVAAIWIFTIRIYKIDSIPIISDISKLYDIIRKRN